MKNTCDVFSNDKCLQITQSFCRSNIDAGKYEALSVGTARALHTLGKK